MKIQTNTGEVELTANMVRPGMVIEGDERHVVTEPIDAGLGWWRVAGRLALVLVLSFEHMVGCDPTIATRADCEVYGVAPGIDAAAHGFARLRSGGAVDLRREAPAASVYTLIDGHGPRYTTGASVSFTEKMRFVGIDATYARAEDVERLCCGAEHAYRVGERAMGRDVCTLAIGDHDTHEDLAMGTRWPAKVAPPDASKWTPVGGEACCACGGIALDGPAAIRILARNERGEDEKGALCQPCGERLRGRGEYRFDKGRLVAAPARPAARAEAAPAVPPVSYAAVRAWLVSRGYTVRPDAQDGYERFERANGHWMCLLVDGRPVVDEHDVEFFADEMKIPAEQVRAGLLDTAAGLVERLTVDLQEAETVPSNPPGMMPDPPGGWRSPEQIDREVSERGRRNREAPLVALVAAVPEGLDPVGWRAAVLAAAERYPETSGRGSAQWVRTVSALLRSGDHVPPGSLTSVVLAVVAYRRALAPQDPRPVPERKTGGRDVRLTVDDGRDD